MQAALSPSVVGYTPGTPVLSNAVDPAPAAATAEDRRVARAAWGVPEDALVLGSHSGGAYWEVPGAAAVVQALAAGRLPPNVWFVGRALPMEALRLPEGADTSRILLFPHCTDYTELARMLAGVDVWLYGRARRETFGQCPAEAATAGCRLLLDRRRHDVPTCFVSRVVAPPQALWYDTPEQAGALVAELAAAPPAERGCPVPPEQRGYANFTLGRVGARLEELLQQTIQTHQQQAGAPLASGV